MKYPLLAIIKLYQWCVRPFLGETCRFYPSCSNYASEALQKHGFFMGSWLMVKRLVKCGPWHRGGQRSRSLKGLFYHRVHREHRDLRQ